ncbi:MAG: nucleoside recognition protein [Rhizobiaceae bacterium]
MPLVLHLRSTTRNTVTIYWELVRLVVPVTIATEVLARVGLIGAISPVLDPVMGLFGLPADLALAWLLGLFVGLWGAVPLLYVLAPPDTLSVADVTVFASLLLFAHGLPIEQKIIKKAGPGLLATTVLRLLGGMIYAGSLHLILSTTGWLSDPVSPGFIPAVPTSDWAAFFLGLFKTCLWMLVILVALAWLLDILKLAGIMGWLMRMLDPLLKLAGIRGEARAFTGVGLFLGIAYGGGLLIREARSGTIPPRQVFMSCIFMGFAHSIIEDTALFLALGADFTGIFVGRLVFAVAATALIARITLAMPDGLFFGFLFNECSPNSGVERPNCATGITLLPSSDLHADAERGTR